MKTWKTVTITTLITLSLSVAWFETYTYLQPSHYEGEQFTNETSSSTSYKNHPKTESTENTNNNEQFYEDSKTSNEEIQYNTMYLDNGPMGWKGINRTGFYVVTPMQQTNNIDVVEITTEGEILDKVTIHGNGYINDNSELNCSSALENAEEFTTWLREQVPSGHTKSGLNSNYNYWSSNCKYKYN